MGRMTQQGGNLFILFRSSLSKHGSLSWLSIYPEKMIPPRVRMETKFNASASKIKQMHRSEPRNEGRKNIFATVKLKHLWNVKSSMKI